jgi:cardiolipin synthase
MGIKIGGLGAGLKKLEQAAQKAGKAAESVARTAVDGAADGFEKVARGAVALGESADNLLQPYGPAQFLPPAGIGLGTSDAELSRVLDRNTASTLTRGNQVKVMVDGQNALPTILGSIDSAQKSICYETYEFDKSGNTVDDVVMHLIAAKERGVDVRVSADAMGGREFLTLHNHELGRLRAAGIPVQLYNPVNSPSALDVHRDHRKSIIIDGQSAFVGGMNTGDRYLGGPDVPKRLHDVFTQIQGPAVADVLANFLDTWKAESGQVIDPATLKGPAGAAVASNAVNLRVIQHTPGQDANIRAAYLALINHATSTINLENSYPMSEDMVAALCAAAQRGVQVRYINGTGQGLLGADARNNFSRLLDAGVHVYLYPTPIHTKSISVDGTFCTVGSSNVDNVALNRNREIITLAEDAAYTRAYDAQLFDKDVVGTADGKKTLELKRPLHDSLFQKVEGAVLHGVWLDTLE